MDWAALLIYVKSWVPSGISGLLIVVVISLIKKIDKNSDKDDLRSRELRDYIDRSLNNFGARVTFVEKEYTKKDDFYRELSGWRSETNRLSDRIASNSKTLSQNIIGILKRGYK